ncbi:MAG: hypothetical protein Q8920_02805 [Bacillota bacterium]|nr:hypothetical protein [Bacillota bacterium]
MKIKHIVLLCSLSLVLGFFNSQAAVLNNGTNEYINNLNIYRFEIQGSDYTNPDLSPVRIGKSIDKIDKVYDYDFNKLESVEKKLKNVDRKTALSYIFNTLTKNCTNNTDKQLAVLRFLYKSSYHNDIQPMYRDRTMVTDPLVLLGLGEMRCGQVNAVAADLFDSVGYNTRMVWLGGHIVSEIYYDNGWHFFDADIFGGSQTVLINKKIPSIVELSKQPFLVDSLPAYYELDYKGTVEQNRGIDDVVPYAVYPSYFYFSQYAYTHAPCYYVKTGDVKNKYYGWNTVKYIPDSNIKIYDFSVKYQPYVTMIKSISKISSSKFRLELNASIDKDNDLIGYDVYISMHSRGWDYNDFKGSTSCKIYWASSLGWKPSMYDKLFSLPPSDIANIKTLDTSITINVPKGKTYYITVTPFDKHGEEVGKKLYYMSSEIKLKN